MFTKETRPDNTKKRVIVGQNDKGFIEALHMVDGEYKSFNVFVYYSPKKTPLFHKSCYKLPTAIKLLKQL